MPRRSTAPDARVASIDNCDECLRFIHKGRRDNLSTDVGIRGVSRPSGTVGAMASNSSDCAQAHRAAPRRWREQSLGSPAAANDGGGPTYLGIQPEMTHV